MSRLSSFIRIGTHFANKKCVRIFRLIYERKNEFMESKKKFGLWTLVLLIFVPTFSFSQISTNAVPLGPSSIPSWIIVSVCFFMPLAFMIAELASLSENKGGGIYSWIDSQLGSRAAFAGTWIYYIANLLFLQWVLTTLPIAFSFMLYGNNIFTDDKANWLPILGIILTIILTFLATTGVEKFSKITDIGGRVMMATVVCFIFFAILGFAIGKYPSAWEFNTATVMPTFDADYFSTFSWLLLAVAGAEVSGTYINQIGESKKIFPKSVIVAALFIAGAYIIGSIAVCLIASPLTLENEGVKSVTYVVFKILGDNWGLNGTIILHIYGGIAALSAIGAYILWLDSPLRAMFAELPEGTLPKFFSKKNKRGILTNALWTQCGLLVFMMLTTVISAFGSVNGLIEYLYTATGTATVVPYIFLAAAYLKFKSNNGTSASTIIKSRGLGIALAVVTICLGLAGFVGTGWYGWQDAESTGAAMKALFDSYGVTIILMILGYLLIFFTKGGSKAVLSRNVR